MKEMILRMYMGTDSLKHWRIVQREKKRNFILLHGMVVEALLLGDVLMPTVTKWHQ